MHHGDFQDHFPGRLEPTTFTEKCFGASGMEYRTVTGLGFVPDPLPPQLDWKQVIYDNHEALLEAHRQLTRVDDAAQDLDNPGLLLGPLTKREAKLSSAIENTFASAQQMALFEDDPNVIEAPNRPEVQEVVNYLHALHHGYRSTLPISRRLILEMHGILLTNVRRRDAGVAGEFRKTQNAIGRKGAPFAEARFVPTPPRYLEQCIRNFENYVNYAVDGDPTQSLPALLRIAIAHYQFETIHPFDDGNGRLGRLIIALQLCKQAGAKPPLVRAPLVYVSGFFEQNRDEYYDRLFRVSTRGHWQDWIAFFLTAVAVQAEDTIRRARRLLDLRQKYRQRVAEKRASGMLPRIIDALFDKPSTTIARVSRLTGMTPAAAGKLVAKLEEKKILEEVTKGQKNRVYIAPEILAISDE